MAFLVRYETDEELEHAFASVMRIRKTIKVPPRLHNFRKQPLPQGANKIRAGKLESIDMTAERSLNDGSTALIAFYTFVFDILVRGGSLQNELVTFHM
jgi:hypothetical protein